MGKGRREREKRSAVAHRLDPAAALLAMRSVTSAEAFRDLCRYHPELLGAEFKSWIDGLCELEACAPICSAVKSLLEADDSEIGVRVAELMERQSHAEAEARRLAKYAGEVEDSVVADPPRAIRLLNQLVPDAERAGLPGAVSFLRESRGKAHFLNPEGSRATNLEAAIEDFRVAHQYVEDANQDAGLLMHAGLAFIERVQGDRAENIERAIEFFDNALALPDLDPGLRSTVQHNAATALLRRQYGDHVANSRAARALCLEVLTYRTPDRNATDWAYTQIALGDALSALVDHDEANLEDARQAYEAVTSHGGDIGEQWLLSAAHRGLARLLRRAALPTDSARAEAAEAGEDLQADRDLLEEAMNHLEECLGLAAASPDPLFAGRVWDEAALILASLDRQDESIDAGRKALASLRPDRAPADGVATGYRVGCQLAEREEWADAAEAFSAAVEASELLFHARLETSLRGRDMAGFGELSRWAAFALAQDDQLERALLVLENGRARELRRRLGADEPAMEKVPEHLRDGFAVAASALVRTPYLSGDQGAGRAFQQVVGEIRRRTGVEDFYTGSTLEEVADAVEEGRPLLYLNPTPYGTLLLLVELDVGGLRMAAEFLESTSLDVLYRLMFGEAALESEHGADVKSFMAAVAGFDDRDPLPEFEKALPWLGKHLMRSATQLTLGSHAKAVTLVPCGPVSAAPLAIAPWTGLQGLECLLDHLTVHYSPSAIAMARAAARAEQLRGTQPTLLALADPTGDLDAAVPEVTEIVETVRRTV